MQKIDLKQDFNTSIQKIEKLLKKSSSAALHEARKNLKKFRAYIRLIRYVIPEEQYIFLNVSARDIARSLAGARDLDSAIEACDRNYPKLSAYEKNLTTRLKKKIERYKKSFKKGKTQNENLYLLYQIQTQLEFINFNSINEQDIAFAYKKMYRKSKNYVKFLTEDDEIFFYHEWRKQVKYLRYQSAFLKDAWPDYYNWYENQLHLLSDILGNMQDNLLLDEYIKEHGFLKAQSAETYFELTHKLNISLKKKALTLGELLFIEPTKIAEQRMFKALVPQAINIPKN